MSTEDQGPPLSGEDVARSICRARDRNIPPAEIAFALGLTVEELAAIEAGDLGVWTATATPEHRRRVASRLRTMAKARTRGSDRLLREEAGFQRVHDLMEAAGVPDGMSVGEAVAAGLISEDAVARAFGDDHDVLP